jgi:hypothetical protein
MSTRSHPLTRFFFNWLFKVKPPEMVKYWKWGQAARAKITEAKDGSMQMIIEGEAHPYPGFPRGHILLGPLAKLKHSIKNRIFNEVFAEIEKMTDDMKYDMLPPEKCAPAVRELNRVLDLMEQAEVVEDMKGRIRLIKRILTFFLQEDDAYRFRAQWAYEHLDPKKMKLSKADKYYFRGKYFKVDHDKFDY